jgi:hypothetical protein
VSACLHFEDLPVGYARELGSFALTQDEMIEFAERWDPAPFHVDPELATASFFGGIVASGLHTVSAIYRLLYDGLMSEIALTAGRGVEFRATDMSEVRGVADAAGEIDVLVNLAGVAMGPTADTDEAAFDGLFQINVKAPFFLVAALAPKDRCPRRRIDHRDVQRSQAIVVMYEPTSFAVC